MTTSTLTPQQKVVMLKHLVAGKNLDFVADVTGIPRDTVLDVVSKHGYPDRDRMGWAIDILVKDAHHLPERPADHRTGVLLDERRPAPTHESLTRRAGSLAITPPALPARPVHTSVAEILHQAGESPWIRTQNLGAKISTLLADLTARLVDEQEAREAKTRADREAAAITARIAALQAEIDKLKRKPAKTATGIVSTHRESPARRPYTQKHGEFACTDPTCDRVFDTPQGAVTHRRRAHEGFNPIVKAAS